MNNLRITNLDVAKKVIITGDLQRADRIALVLDNCNLIAENREFKTYTGYWKNEKVSVVSTGIGAPAAAIVVEELHMAGVETIIRVGTSGAISKDVKVGDIIIATGAYRDEGTTKQYVASEFPAVADYRVVNALVGMARKKGMKTVTGIVHTKDALAMELPEEMPLCKNIKEKWEMLQKANILVTEMESSVLMVLSSIYKMKAGAVIVSAGLTYNGQPDVPYKLYEKSIEDAIILTLDTLADMSDEEE